MPVPILESPRLVYEAAYNHVALTGHAEGLLHNDDPNRQYIGTICLHCEEGWQSPRPSEEQPDLWPYDYHFDQSAKGRVRYLEALFRRALEAHRGPVAKRSAWSHLMDEE